MLPRVRIHRPKQCRKVLADQYADTTQGAGDDIVDPGQNHSYQPFPYQRVMVYSRPSRLRLCTARQGAAAADTSHYRGIYTQPTADDMSVCARRLPPRPTEN